jgi:hypothetical protein
MALRFFPDALDDASVFLGVIANSLQLTPQFPNRRQGMGVVVVDDGEPGHDIRNIGQETERRYRGVSYKVRFLST